MEQTQHNVRSTNPKPAPSTKHSAKFQALPVSPPSLPVDITNEVHIWETTILKHYLDYTGRFPVRYRSGNRYGIIVFHCDSNTIMQASLKQKIQKLFPMSLQLNLRTPKVPGP